jgi:hypothetical protein
MAFVWNSLRLVFALTVAFFAHPFFHLLAMLQGRGRDEAWKTVTRENELEVAHSERRGLGSYGQDQGARLTLIEVCNNNAKRIAAYLIDHRADIFWQSWT